jgi:thioredoxin 1
MGIHMVKSVQDDDFEVAVLKSTELVLVDFWAEWCGPCRMLSSVIDEVSKEFEGSVQVMKMNVDDSPITPSQYGVRGIPTLMLFKNGKLLDTKVGALPKDTLISWIQHYINR